jgi:hypothetical protein
VTQALDIVATTPEGAHKACEEAWRICKELTLAGKRVQIVAREDEDDRSLKQNRYYWGVVLKEISAQARVEGQRYAAEAWHELFKRQFLGYEIKRVKVAGRKRPVVIRRLRSTTTQTVPKFSRYLEQIQAFAVTELSVVFSSDWWE